jgi:hypothetical protein
MEPKHSPDKSSNRRDQLINYWATAGIATLLAALITGLSTGLLSIDHDVNPANSSPTTVLPSPPETTTQRSGLESPTSRSLEESTGPSVRRQGILTLERGASANLDSSNPDWDVSHSFLAEFEADLYNYGGTAIHSNSSSHLVSIGPGKADYARCAAEAIFSDDEIENLAVGLRFCVQTKLGRIALARILKLSAEGDGPL